jgi:hypothetical protein
MDDMPLLTDRVREKIPWIQLGIESVLVVLSVLLALGLDAWYDHSQEQEKINLALRGIHAELSDTRRLLKDRIPHHAALIDTMRSDSLSFQQPISLLLVNPDNEAWQTAQQTGAVALMDYEVAAPISNAYARASDLQFLFRKTYDLTFDGPNYLGMNPEAMSSFWGYLNDYKSMERRLLTRSTRALEAIETRIPSLAESPASASAEPDTAASR